MFALEVLISEPGSRGAAFPYSDLGLVNLTMVSCPPRGQDSNTSLTGPPKGWALRGLCPTSQSSQKGISIPTHRGGNGPREVK